MEEILGVKVDFDITKKELLDLILDLVNKESFSLISTTNAEFVLDAQNDPEFKRILNEANLSIPDGAGLFYAHKYLQSVRNLRRNVFRVIKAFWLGLKLGFTKNKFSDSRLVGREIIYDLCALAQQNNYSVFLLGGWEKDRWGRPKKSSGNISGRAAQKLKSLYPGLNIVGYSSDFSRALSDDQRTIDFIQTKMKDHKVSQIDIMFVAYNHIHQEKWIHRNANKIPAKVCLGVGGTLDYVAGSYMTSPRFFTTNNLEWLFKLLVQPWRIGRILRVFPIFPLKVFYSALKS